MPQLQCRLLLGLMMLAPFCSGCASLPHAQSPVHVLFVGNSLTYVGNLPAVLDGLASANGHRVQSDMIVEGGATLAQRVADGSVARALQEKRYDYVVLQERGGDAICSSSKPDYCPAAEMALRSLTQLARQRGATPILMGTYQTAPPISKVLVETEAVAAKRLCMAYVPLSERVRAATAFAPSANWFYSDGLHPGHDLILLESMLLYRQLFGSLPAAASFSVDAPMFTPHSKFSAPLPTSRAIFFKDIQQSYVYSMGRVAIALAMAKGSAQ